MYHNEVGQGVILGRCVRVVGIGVVLAACAACGAPAAGQHPYAADYTQARELASDARILAMVQDDWITDAEDAEAQQIAVECMRDRGLDVDVAGDGFVFHDVVGKEAQVDSISSECESKTVSLIHPLYEAQRINPEHADMGELLVGCMKRVGAVDPAMTLEEWRNLSEYPDAADPDVAGCLANPYAYKNPDAKEISSPAPGR